jgi:ComF family protein
MDVNMARIPAAAWRGLLDLLMPNQCLACGRPVAEPASLCAGCFGGLRHIEEPVCEALGTPLPYDQGPGALSAAALAAPPVWNRARAAVAFDDVSKILVHHLKYRDRQEAGLVMARMMARAGRRLIEEADLIVPVPLYRLRLWQRRFNQAAFLARELARHSGLAWRGDLLLRRRATPAQVGLDAEERRRNVRNAFALKPGQAHSVTGKSILLIDDVRTTGATAEACTRVLAGAGAARVDVLTFALVLAPARFHI